MEGFTMFPGDFFVIGSQALSRGTPPGREIDVGAGSATGGLEPSEPRQGVQGGLHVGVAARAGRVLHRALQQGIARASGSLSALHDQRIRGGVEGASSGYRLRRVVG